LRICPQCGSDRVSEQWRCSQCGYAPREEDGIPLLAPNLARGTGVDADYRHHELTEAEARHFWFVARSKLIVWAVRRYFPGAATLLDVGCGSGGVAAALGRALPAVRIVAGDVLISGLQIAKSRTPGQEFIQLDVSAIPYDAAFSVVGAFDVLEHLDDDEAVLREMWRAAVPGGGIILTVPQHRWLWSAVDDFSQHRRRYSRGELRDKVERAGFRVERVTSFMTFVLPLIAASRLAKNDVAMLDPVGELNIGTLANRALQAVCASEAALLDWGLSFPIGGSLLLVARRP
jgi:ubiquinone/menaquinone biosynthesis C-methylase UbiE